MAKGLLPPPVVSAKPSSIPQAPQPPKCSASLQQPPRLGPSPSVSPLSSRCWFTDQFSLLTVHPQAQLFQPKTPLQAPTDPARPSTGFLWVLELDGRQGEAGTVLSHARSHTLMANVQQ